MENKVLVVIDAQEDFTRGSLKNDAAVKALPVIREIVEYAYLNFEHKTLYTQDAHDAETYPDTLEGKKLPVPHCIKGTKGFQICYEVLTEKAMVFEKEHFGSLGWMDIIPSNAEEIWLCGFCTDICVMANYQILRAAFPETTIRVFQDACAGSTERLHGMAIQVMKTCHADVEDWLVFKNQLYKEDKTATRVNNMRRIKTGRN